ncbi:hypothetical protein LOK49_LG05G02064 [Camellia lanceoleosa]|uniref:Uncharacterized protein n=1 Tax=Camellia lanceoleosa TaxID=1840588 RepID=A0ACC0HNK8_9ERIC|nr:hypothetical protein LOK49_LG05G02064 [Camellia lanceoleosa]
MTAMPEQREAIECITQQEFTDMAWQSIVSLPEVAKENKHQIVETEHLMKALLEQKNGLLDAIDSTCLLDAIDKVKYLKLYSVVHLLHRSNNDSPSQI